MRVAIDVKSVALHETGIAVYTRNLVRVLAESASPDCQYLLIGPERALHALPCAPHFEKHALELRTPIGPLRIPVYDQLDCARLARQKRADLLVTPNCDAAVLSRVPNLVVVHDIAYLRFPHWYPPAYRCYYGLLLQWHARRARGVISDSEFARTEIEAAVARRRPVHVVPCPIEAEFFTASETSVLPPRLQAVASRPYMLYSGGADPRKDLGFVWAGFARAALRPEFKDVSLLVTGSDPGLNMFVEWASAAGLDDRVRLAGYVEREAMPQVYARAAAVVYAPRYEGFGLPVLEALAAGKPVVTTSVGFVRELDPDLVRLVPSDDVDALSAALVTVVTDEQSRRHVAQHGPAQAREIVNRVRPAFEQALRATAAGLLDSRSDVAHDTAPV